jgi:ribose 5-phosphate isomerase B
MIVAVGADHAGFELKGEIVRWLETQGHQINDVGAYEFDSNDDYPDFAVAVADALVSGGSEKGIVICGSGVGACITANKVKGIRACLCHDTYSARQGVEHDDMNVICIGGRIIGVDLAKVVLEAFLNANFIPEPRFQRRLDKIMRVEKDGLP